MKTISLFALLTFLTPALTRGDATPPQPALRIQGSAVMAPLTTALGEALKGDLRVAVDGGGSGIGFRGLQADQADIATSTRAIKPDEKAAIEKDGRKVTEIVIGYDAVAICVHKDNPLKSASLEQLNSVWMRDGKSSQWNDLEKGLPANLIDLYGLPFASALPGVLPGLLRSTGKPQLKREVQECPTAEDILDHVAKEPHAMGCVRFASVTDKVKVLPVSASANAAAVALSAETVAGGTWPLNLPLYLYTTNPDAPAVKTFIAFAQSKAGRDILTKEGFTAPKDTKK